MVFLRLSASRSNSQLASLWLDIVCCLSVHCLRLGTCVYIEQLTVNRRNSTAIVFFINNELIARLLMLLGVLVHHYYKRW